MEKARGNCVERENEGLKASKAVKRVDLRCRDSIVEEKSMAECSVIDFLSSYSGVQKAWRIHLDRTYHISLDLSKTPGNAKARAR
jgi:hypothetical protein